MNRAAAVLLAGVLSLSLCACIGQPVEPSPTPGRTPVSAPVEERSFSLAYDPTASLHPITGDSQVNLMLTPLVYEGLFALDESFTPQPVLAQDAQRDHSGTVWTITLREGVVFSDGTALTAAHVVSSLNSARTGARYAKRLEKLVSVREVSGQVVITLSEPNGALPTLLDLPIVLEAPEEPAPLGTGRYRYAVQGDELSLLVNYNREGSLPFDSITLHRVSSVSERISAFDSGAVSAVLTDFTSPYALGYSCDFERWDYTTTDLLYVGFRCIDSPCAESLVRRAVARALDREHIVSSALDGAAEVSALPVPEAHTDWCAAGAQELSCDLSEAARLLEQAGYKKDEADGLLRRKGTVLTLTLLVNSDNEAKRETAQLLAQELAQLGISVTVNALPWKDYVSALENGAFDLYLGEVRLTGNFDLTELLTGSLNYGGYDPASLAKQLAARKAYSGRARAIACEALWSSFAQEVPIAPLCFMRESLLLRWGTGVTPTPLQSDPFHSMESW